MQYHEHWIWRNIVVFYCLHCIQVIVCLWVFNTLKCLLWVHLTVMSGGNIYWGRKQIIVKEIAQLSVVGCPWICWKLTINGELNYSIYTWSHSQTSDLSSLEYARFGKHIFECLTWNPQQVMEVVLQWVVHFKQDCCWYEHHQLPVRCLVLEQ